MTTFDAAWWRTATIYQVYIRSFADGNGDGEGDITGLLDRLPYLRDLGVDALWINPWYPSPLLDGGYDVADFRGIDPRFGTLEQAEQLIEAAHADDMKIILDIVPNHTSSAHPWFAEALAAGPGSPQRSRYLFRDGTGANGDEPPNNWHSVFGGPAWERVTESDGSPGQWYLHLFDVSQPDLAWANEDVRAEFLDILRFWFDRGVDGFRIDVAHGLIKAEGLPPVPVDEKGGLLATPEIDDHPFFDRPEVHEIFRQWRKIADSYDEPRVFVAEAWVNSPEKLADYVRPDELHTAFNFDFLKAPWSAADLRTTIDSSIEVLGSVDAPTTWVLENHDVERVPTRYGRARTNAPVGHERTEFGAVDLAVGRRRARAAALLMFALPGGAYVYQGQELGLHEVLDLPDDALQDPVWERSGHTERGRDGCRVPLPWTASGPSHGFGSGGSWLPQPADWGTYSVEATSADPASMLNLYRRALHLRAELFATPGRSGAASTDELVWVERPEPEVLEFHRGEVAIVVNTGTEPVDLGPHQELLLLSEELAGDGRLPGDAAAWLRV